jgi:hypothetical protein
MRLGETESDNRVISSKSGGSRISPVSRRYNYDYLRCYEQLASIFKWVDGLVSTKCGKRVMQQHRRITL